MCCGRKFCAGRRAPARRGAARQIAFVACALEAIARPVIMSSTRPPRCAIRQSKSRPKSARSAPWKWRAATVLNAALSALIRTSASVSTACESCVTSAATATGSPGVGMCEVDSTKSSSLPKVCKAFAVSAPALFPAASCIASTSASTCARGVLVTIPESVGEH